MRKVCLGPNPVLVFWISHGLWNPAIGQHSKQRSFGNAEDDGSFSSAIDTLSWALSCVRHFFYANSREVMKQDKTSDKTKKRVSLI